MENRMTDTTVDNQATTETVVSTEATTKEFNLANIPELAKFKTTEDLAKSYINLEKSFSKKVTEIDSETLQTVYNKLGRPEKAEGYELPTEGIPAEEVDKFKQRAFEAGLTQTAANKLFNEMMTEAKANLSAAEQAKAAENAAKIEALKASLGTAFEKRMALIDAHLAQSGEKIENMSLGALKVLAEAVRIIEAPKVLISEQAAKFGETPADIQEKINSLLTRKDTADALFNRQHPRNKEVMAEYQALLDRS